jgi:hypothetical protein
MHEAVFAATAYEPSAGLPVTPAAPVAHGALIRNQGFAGTSSARGANSLYPAMDVPIARRPRASSSIGLTARE